MTKNSNHQTNKNEPIKKSLPVVIALVAALCVLTVLITTNLAGCNNQKSEATPDSVGVTEPTIDELSYTFSEGIYAGSVHLGGLVYKDAKEQVLEECDKMVKDFELTVTAADQEFKYGKADFSYDNNASEVLSDAVKYNDKLTNGNNKKSENKVFELSVSVSESSVDAKVSDIAKAVDKEAKNATIGGAENNDVSFVQDSTGLKLQQETLKKDMLKEINAILTSDKTSAKIEAKVDEVQPSLTYDDLSGKIQLLSSFSTYSTNTVDGNHNMALALAACNGSVIEPGETWSFNACTGNSNLTSLGYREATVIIGGELVPGVGGGLCQSSTTIYNAALRTNLEIVERYCHYFQSTYADAGLDATIDYPYLDLKLKNPTEYPMYFQCYMSGRTLYCNIYGYQDPSFDEVKVYSSIYEANRKQNYYKASAERVFLKNGKEVYREQLPYSTYHYVSPSEENTTAPTTAPATKPVVKPTTPPVQATTTPVITPVTPPTEPTPTLPNDPVEPSEPEMPVVTNPVEY